MAYQRFVTYLFRYKNGRKEENCGFARVEVRQNRARMEIQVRGVPDGTDRVYLIALGNKENKEDLEMANEAVQKKNAVTDNVQISENFLEGTVPKEVRKRNGQLVGAYIGNLVVRDGSGRERFAFDAESVGGTPYGMEEMAGIYIRSAGGFLGSQWVDEELDWGSFQEYEPLKMKEDAGAALDIVTDSGENMKKMDAAENSAPVLNPSSELQATQAAAAARAETPQLQKRVSSYINTWERQWRQFTASHPLFCPFDEAPEILAVKMDLRDFKLLPKTYLPLANNSFLLHGYFNYKYLLFGYMDGEPRRWFLGVPGVFQNQEQLLAGLFGFGEFRTKHLTKQKTGEFGYWYRYLEL